MATEETAQPIAEEPVADSPPAAPAADKPEEAAGEENKVAATKKTKAKKPAAPRKPRTAATHPSYFEVIRVFRYEFRLVIASDLILILSMG